MEVARDAIYAILMVGVVVRYLVEVKLDIYYGTDTMELIPFCLGVALFALPVVLFGRGIPSLMAVCFRKFVPLRSGPAPEQ